MPGGSAEELECVREEGQAVFQYAVLIRADTLPERAVRAGRSLLVASVRIAARFRETLNMFVGLQRSENDRAPVNSYCVS